MIDSQPAALQGAQTPAEPVPWHGRNGKLKVLDRNPDIRSLDVEALLSGKPGCYSERVCVCVMLCVCVCVCVCVCACVHSHYLCVHAPHVTSSVFDVMQAHSHSSLTVSESRCCTLRKCGST